MRFLAKSKRKLSILFLVFILAYIAINYVDLKINSIVSENSKTGILLPKNIYKKKIDFDTKILVKNNLTQLENVNIILLDTTKQKRTSMKRYFAVDGNNMGIINHGVTKCSDTIEVEIINSNRKDEVDFVYFLDILHSVEALRKASGKLPFTMVYGMESEPHSASGDSWLQADFRMWYNLDLSFPEPATYFDVKSFLPDLLSPPRVEFKDKETSAPLCWVLSNCNAFNGRERYVKRLMELISVDSYGFCLRNKNSHTGSRMHGNIELYSKYKFVIAIENSNCADYVTEKLVHTVASGSIPIVAGKDGKPDYLRYLPKGSFINIYDFKNQEELAKHLNLVASNEMEYEKYMKYKRHSYSREHLRKLPLKEIIDLAKTLIDPKEKFFSELILKEKSENKICKIARYLDETPQETTAKEIAARKIKRPSVSEACLPPQNLGNDFNN